MISRGKERRNAISYEPQRLAPESPTESGDESADSDLTTQPPNTKVHASPPTPSPSTVLVSGQRDGSSRSNPPTAGRRPAPSPPLRDVQIASQLRPPSNLRSTKPHRKKKKKKKGKKDKAEKAAGVTVMQSIPERKEESSSASDTMYMKAARSPRRREGIDAGKREEGEEGAIVLQYPAIPGSSAQSGLASTMRLAGDTRCESEDETGR